MRWACVWWWGKSHDISESSIFFFAMNERFISIRQAELQRALKALRPALKGKAGRDAEALLSFEGDQAVFTLPGADASTPVEEQANWYGTARFSASVLEMLRRVPVQDDPIKFEYHDCRLQIGSLTVPCSWQDISPASPIKLPIDPTWVDYLIAGNSYPEEVIAGSGLINAVRKAELRKKDLIEKAARLLSEVGITADEIEAMVEKKLKQRRTAD